MLAEWIHYGETLVSAIVGFVANTPAEVGLDGSSRWLVVRAPCWLAGSPDSITRLRGADEFGVTTYPPGSILHEICPVSN